MINPNIEPREVFSNFFAISEIPRGSGNEKAVSDFIAAFARERGADVLQDKSNNLIIKKPASAGLADKPPVILQAHLDMVCEKNTGTAHDFLRDAIDFYVDGDYVKARGTTLGADNGIGVAMCMALIAGDYAHPPLEILLTTEEETGMDGALNLDISHLRGTRMINLDSSDDTRFTMGCAAGTTVEFILPAKWENVAGLAGGDYTVCKISVSGLVGGHSGGDINKERGNALRILGFLLEKAARETGELYIAEISGGMKVNAIPREASATVIFPASAKEKFEAIKTCRINMKEQFRVSDAGLKIDWAFPEKPASEACPEVLSRETTQKVISALLLIPNGAVSLSLEIDGLVNASCNIGVAETTREYVKLSAMTRGAARFYNSQTETQISLLAATLGAKANHIQRSPAWPYNPESALLAIAQQTYRALFNSEAKPTAVHGGLECGIFSEKFAEKGISLDIISLGPNAHDYHTPDERVSISSTGRMWGFLKELLKQI